MAVPYIFVSGTVIDPDQMNDNFTYVLSQTTDAMLLDGTTAMLAPLPLYAGSLALPGLTFDGDANTGIYRSGADTFVFVSGGAAVATVSSGTLTVNGSLAISTPVTVAAGGTGAATLTGLLQGNGTSAITGGATINNDNWSGTDLSVANGGTGASTLTGLLQGNGTGAITGSATINDSNWSGTDLAVANGGTGASTLASGLLRGNGTSAVTGGGTISNSDWSGTDLAVVNGGTGASDAATARTNLGVAIGTDVVAAQTTGQMPVGWAGYMYYSSTTALANGDSTAGTNVETWVAHGSGFTFGSGTVQTGTWKNVSGYTLDANGAEQIGLMVRTS